MTRPERAGEALRFLVAGGACFLLEYGLLYALETLGLHYLTANAIAFLLSVALNYLLCRFWVFRRARDAGVKTKAAFLLTSVVGLLLNEALLWALVDALRLHYMLAKPFATAAVLVYNYFAKRRALGA